MKAVLTSIQPPHTDNIFNLIKGIEWRTKPMPTGTHHCYETKNGGGCGKVIGEFKVWRVKRYGHVSHIPEEYITLGCVSREYLSAYSKNKPLYAHFIVSPKRYDKPKELSEFCTLDNEAVQKCKHRVQSYFDGYCNSGHLKCGFYCSKKDDWCDKCKVKPITRPPQSWCYVEQLEGE